MEPKGLVYMQDTINNLNFLDTIDMTPYLERSNNVENIMNMLEEDYDDTNKLPEELEGCLFNCITIDEFAAYLADKYNKNICETTKVTYELFPKKEG